jgi:hypothetical protein
MSSFANLKRNASSLEKLAKAIESSKNQSEGGSKDDNRFWTPTVDKAGNGMAIIRFLPAAADDGDDALPWVRIFGHGFQGPGGWLIDNCLTTVNGKCPVCEHNSTLWNSGIEANKDIVRKQKRKLNYVANIYIVSDPANKENEGQVKLFKFGKKIFDKITEAMNPEFADETPLNPFDLWTGANFKVKIRNVEGYRNYDKSEFDAVGPLKNDDAELEKIWKSEHSLKEFTDPSKFKSYDQIRARLDKALGFDGMPVKSKAEDVAESIDVPFKATSSVNLASEEDEDLDYFKGLAKAD